MTPQDAALLANLTGFTPGPWVQEALTHTDPNGDDYETDVEVASKHGFHIHRHDLGYDDYVDAQISANAALIAAAPDLHRLATEQAAEIERLRLERDILLDAIEEMQADRTGYGVIIAGMVKP